MTHFTTLMTTVIMKKEVRSGQPTRKAMTSVKVVTETATPEEIVMMITNNTWEVQEVAKTLCKSNSDASA